MTIFSNNEPPPTSFHKLDRARIIIIYNYFTGKLRIFYITMRVPGNLWLSKIFTFLKKYLYTILSYLGKKMSEFFHENFVGSLFYLILLSPKERNLTSIWWENHRSDMLVKRSKHASVSACINGSKKSNYGLL